MKCLRVVIMMMMVMVIVHSTEPHHNHPGVQAVRAFNLAVNIPLPSKAPLLSLLMHHIQQHPKDSANRLLSIIANAPFTYLYTRRKCVALSLHTRVESSHKKNMHRNSHSFCRVQGSL